MVSHVNFGRKQNRTFSTYAHARWRAYRYFCVVESAGPPPAHDQRRQIFVE